MNSIRAYSLGEACPSSPHAVVSCLPTMADVRGYEEKESRVLDALTSGYPRFVIHAYIRELVDFYLQRESLEGRAAVLIPGRRATQDLVNYVGRGLVSVQVEASLYLVLFDADNLQLDRRVRKFVQRTGCGISSRQAEDLLFAHGQKTAIQEESSFAGASLPQVEKMLAEIAGSRPEDVLLCASGMNAFYAGFRAVQEAQAAQGRTQWLQLGWLYLDSGSVLEEFLHKGERLDYCYDATGTEAIIERIQSYGDDLACVVLECPTNPLVQVADLPRISAAVRAAGGVLMIDPTIASVYNVDVLPYADLVVTSLTKYAACEGDVMIGALMLNPESPNYSNLVLRTSSFHQPPYSRDLDRLAEEMHAAPEAVRKMDRNAREVAEFLRAHPAVRKVHYAGESEHFSEVAKNPEAGGAVITFELKGSMETFYDALQMMKGPSFGTRFSLVCPFMYLAHYDLVTDDSGRNFLRSINIDPELIRLSVGTEAVDAIKAVLDCALGAR